jgi:hypothetical protein
MLLSKTVKILRKVLKMVIELGQGALLKDSMNQYVQDQITLEDGQQNFVWSNKMEIMRIYFIAMFIIIVMEVLIRFNIVHMV